MLTLGLAALAFVAAAPARAASVQVIDRLSPVVAGPVPLAEFAASPPDASRRDAEISVYALDARTYAELTGRDTLEKVARQFAVPSPLDAPKNAERIYILYIGTHEELYASLRALAGRGRIKTLVLVSHMFNGGYLLGGTARPLGELPDLDMAPNARIVMAGCDFAGEEDGFHGLQYLGLRYLRRHGGKVMGYTMPTKTAPTMYLTLPMDDDLAGSFSRFMVLPADTAVGRKLLGLYKPWGINAHKEDERRVPADEKNLLALRECGRIAVKGWAACLRGPTRNP